MIRFFIFFCILPLALAVFFLTYLQIISMSKDVNASYRGLETNATGKKEAFKNIFNHGKNDLQGKSSRPLVKHNEIFYAKGEQSYVDQQKERVRIENESKPSAKNHNKQKTFDEQTLNDAINSFRKSLSNISKSALILEQERMKEAIASAKNLQHPKAIRDTYIDEWGNVWIKKTYENGIVRFDFP